MGGAPQPRVKGPQASQQRAAAPTSSWGPLPGLRPLPGAAGTVRASREQRLRQRLAPGNASGKASGSKPGKGRDGALKQS